MIQHFLSIGEKLTCLWIVWGTIHVSYMESRTFQRHLLKPTFPPWLVIVPAIDSTLMCPWSLYWHVIPKVTAVGDGAWAGDCCEGSLWVDGISALLQRDLGGLPRPFFQVMTEANGHLWTRKRARTRHPSVSTVDSPHGRDWEMKFCCFKAIQWSMTPLTI